jgi:hypothetical protein
MSESPPNGPPLPSRAAGFPTSPGQFPDAAVIPPSWPSTPPRGQSRTLTFVALGIALVATGLAIVGWFRPSPPPPASSAATPTYTEQQVSEAKRGTCEAFSVVNKGITLQTNGADSDNLALVQAEAANARLSTISGGGI